MPPEQCNQEREAIRVPPTLEPVAMQTANSARGPRVILVAEEPKSLSPEVLERADALRSALGFELRFLPAVPEWEREEPLERLLRQAALPDVALVVLASPPRHPEGGRDGRWHELLRRSQRPLLFVGTRGPSPVIVAASDCSDPALPVVREAGIIASALGSTLMLVHNIDPTASQFTQRIGLPLSRQLADLLAMRLREELEQAAVRSEVVITREVANADAVLEVAQAQGAELLVIGVKPLEAVRTRTADAILDAASQSVLFIPLLSASKALLMD